MSIESINHRLLIHADGIGDLWVGPRQAAQIEQNNLLQQEGENGEASGYDDDAMLIALGAFARWCRS